MPGTTSSSRSAEATLRLPAANQPAAAATLKELRRFHLGSAAGTALPPDLLPALLAPFRAIEHVRHDYPLLLETSSELQCRSLRDVLPELVAKVASSRLLQDNAVRLERQVRLRLAQCISAAAAPLLNAAGEQMLGELTLREDLAAGVRSELAALCAAFPKGQLLTLDRTTPLRLLAAAAAERRAAASSAFASKVDQLVLGLRNLLQAEAAKDPSAHAAPGLQKSLGAAAGRFLDPTALARAVGSHRGSAPIDPQRRRRLTEASETLAQWRAGSESLVLVHDGKAPLVAGIPAEQVPDPCDAAAQRFDQAATSLLHVLRAAAAAELELQGAYDPSRHDPILLAMDWRSCTPAELQLLPVFVAQIEVDTLCYDGMQPLVRLLASGRPVQVLVVLSPAADPALDREAGTTPYRLELGYLGIAFREAFVQQSTAARPLHLLTGYQRALASARPGLHVVASGLDSQGQEPPLGTFLHAGAAIEGRAHPLFHYDPAAGQTWARRLDFAGNPAPDADWPASDLACMGADGAATRLPLPFTYADFALLEPDLRAHFALVPDSLQSAELVPLSDFLQLSATQAAHALPFVWAADADGALHRIAVRRTLVSICGDRLRYWRTLQELAGVRNEHVREAVQRAREDAAAAAQREREELTAQHRSELERVRAEAAGSAMQGLARMLLELDPLATAVPAAAPLAPGKAETAQVVIPAATTPPAAAATKTAPPTKPVAAAIDDDLDEPWIDTPRCSTCNDCVNLNPLLFVYDSNKQARIGDLRKGTFAQLVQAAEKCPARCIHPGKPMNQDEPGLAELVQRAAPYR